MDSSAADFVWRFRLDEKPAAMVYDDPLLELIRVEWEQLLRLCTPTFEGKPVRIDGFALMRDPERNYLVFDDDITRDRKGGSGVD